MLGAIIGDICGSVYEWKNQKDINKVELFKQGSFPTDDSVMTVAVARAFMDSENMDDDWIKEILINSMHYYGALFSKAGYGGNFSRWLGCYERNAYNSFGNGSGMRVSPIGWLYDSLAETLYFAKISAEVTHNHPEGIKGAQAIAACIYLARTAHSKDEIRIYVEDNFYDLDFTLDEIRPRYVFDVTCQGSCPQAIVAFLESDDFDDAIRKAISIGGDSDTIAAMTGAIAEAFYGIPLETARKCFKILVNRTSPVHAYNNSVIASVIRDFWKSLEDRGMTSPRVDGLVEETVDQNDYVYKEIYKDRLYELYVKKRENTINPEEKEEYERLFLAQSFEPAFVEQVLDKGYRLTHKSKLLRQNNGKSE